MSDYVPSSSEVRRIYLEGGGGGDFDLWFDGVRSDGRKAGWTDARDAALATMKRGYPLVDGDTAQEMMRTLNDGLKHERGSSETDAR